MQPIEERLDLVRFKVDKTPHIRLNSEECKECDTTPCVFVCPAGLFELLGGEMHFSYEHCLECGTCYVACERKAIEWDARFSEYGIPGRAIGASALSLPIMRWATSSWDRVAFLNRGNPVAFRQKTLYSHGNRHANDTNRLQHRIGSWDCRCLRMGVVSIVHNFSSSSSSPRRAAQSVNVGCGRRHQSLKEAMQE